MNKLQQIKEYKEQYWDMLWWIIKKTNQWLFDNHHITPISLYWHDLQHNIEEIRRPLHEYIHQKLNIPMKDYSRSTRKIKKKTNHKLIHTPDLVVSVRELQKQYFNWLNNMPIEVVNMHERKMFETCQYMERVYNKVTGKENKINSFEKFDVLHDHYCRLWYIVAKKIQSDVHKKYFI